MKKHRLQVAIASYGNNQLQYLRAIVKEFLSYKKFDVQVVIHSNIPLKFTDQRVRVRVEKLSDWQELPYQSRHSLAENASSADLFLYTENDTLYREKSILAWIKANNMLSARYIPGFMQIEKYREGLFYPAYHKPYNWKPKTITVRDWHFGFFTNLHHGGFLVDSDQLRVMMHAGSFLSKPGCPVFRRNTKKVHCCTTPYTLYGMEKVIPITHFDDFLIHHLPNKYRTKMGSFDDKMRVRISQLLKQAQ